MDVEPATARRSAEERSPMTSSRPGVRRFTVTESREVMEVTAGNLEEVAAWCGGTVERTPMPDGTTSEYVMFDSTNSDDLVCPGSIMVRTSAGFYWTDPDEFAAMAAGWTEVTP